MTLRKRNILLIACGVFFLLVNTSYFWDGWLGVGAMLSFLLLVVCFFVLAGVLLWQLTLTVWERFADKNRLLVTVVLAVVLITSFFYPNGVIKYTRFEPENLLVAQREGAANCTTTLKLRENGSFLERNVCFGVTETTGRYRISDDTIFFEDVSLGRHVDDFFEFAVVKPKGQFGNELGDLVRYRSYSDTVGVALWISKNEMEK